MQKFMKNSNSSITNKVLTEKKHNWSSNPMDIQCLAVFQAP